MTNRVQTLRSSVAGNRPTGRTPGELYVNWPDGQLGTINASSNPQDLIAVRFFSTGTSYNTGDHVIQSGALYKAIVPVSPGTFNPTQWGLAGGGVTMGDTAPSSPQVGSLWWDSVGGNLYVWYNDGTSSQWVVVVNTATILPPATTTTLGGVKVDGTTIKAAADGTISTAAVMGDNRIDNGDMWIDQHNGGASYVVPAGGYLFGPDRWGVSNTLAKFTAGQNYSVTTKAPGFQYFLGVVTTGTGAAPTAAAVNYICQGIEYDRFTDFGWGTANAQSATLSFWVNSSLTGNFSVSLQGGAASPQRTFITTYNISTANTWTKIVITIPADTTISSTNWTGAGNAPGVYLCFDLGSGTSVQTATNLGVWQNTANLWVASGAVKLVATTNAKWAITGVKLEVGSVATAFNHKSLANSVADCQRYFQKVTYFVGGYCTAGAVNPATGSTTFPVAMRATPSVNLGTPSYSNASALSIGPYPDSFTAGVTITVTGLYSASSGLSFSAEI